MGDQIEVFKILKGHEKNIDINKKKNLRRHMVEKGEKCEKVAPPLSITPQLLFRMVARCLTSRIARSAFR